MYDATNTTGSYCLKYHQTCIEGHIIFTLYARNVCLQYERKHADTAATSPTARSMNSVIQTVLSFLMRHLISSTSEILVRAGGGHFQHA